MRASVYLALPVMILLAILQTAVLPHLPILGLVPQFPFLVALAWGLLHDTEEGVTWAFVGGLFADLFSLTPLGLTALIWMLASLAVIQLTQIFPTSRFILPALAGWLGTLVTILLSFVSLRLFGYQTSVETITAVLPLAILHGILILPVYWLMYTILQRQRSRR